MKWAEQTVLSNDDTCGLGTLTIDHPPGSFPVTPATRIALEAIGSHQNRLRGQGIDWGCGSGPLTMAASRVASVRRVCGMDINPDNVATARRNAATNGVHGKTVFYLADSFVPQDGDDAASLDQWKGCTNFILANPPASEGDDGFGFRRRVLRESVDFLISGGSVFLNVSIQYGRARIEGLADVAEGLRHVECLASTEWIPFDLLRPDLMDCLLDYVAEEQRGGLPYEFNLPGQNVPATAVDALAFYRDTGESPRTQWQIRLFEYG